VHLFLEPNTNCVKRRKAACYPSIAGGYPSIFFVCFERDTGFGSLGAIRKFPAMKNTLLVTLVSLLVALFVYTGSIKLISFDRFRIELSGQVLPAWTKPVLLYTLPVFELVLAGGLLFKSTRLAALWTSFGLIILFTIYTILVLSDALSKTPCPCGGLIGRLSWKGHLVFNLVYLAVNAGAIILCMHANRTTRKPAEKSRGFTSWSG
jgi:putative oxidoreductase